MATLDRISVARPLTRDSLPVTLEAIRRALHGRAEAAFLFGSAARGGYTSGSDLDILIVTETTEKFARRPFAYLDLFEFYPRLDLVVYTPKEFEQMRERTTSFWKAFRLDAVKLI